MTCGAVQRSHFRLRCSNCLHRSRAPKAICCAGHAGRALEALQAGAEPRRYAVVGAGFAGWACAYHLLAKAPREVAVEVHVFDAVGPGAGGSGAAAGLLHPFSPRGKVLWRGEEAMRHALQLLHAAQAAAAAQGDTAPLFWANGMVRPAASAKQSRDFFSEWGGSPTSSSSSSNRPSAADAACADDVTAGGGASSQVAHMLRGGCLSAAAACEMVPGLVVPALAAAGCASAAPTSPSQPAATAAAPRARKQRQATPAGWSLEAAGALHVPGGLTVHPQRYIRALQAACRAAAADRAPPGSRVQLHVRRLESVGALLQEGAAAGRAWQGVVVAAGAGAATLREFKSLAPLLDLCQGYTLDCQPAQPAPQQQQAPAAAAAGAGAVPVSALVTSPASNSSPLPPHGGGSSSSSSSSTPYPATAPSVLGQPYLASQGGQLLVLGASQEHGWSAEAALRECAVPRQDQLRQLAAVARAAAAAGGPPAAHQPAGDAGGRLPGLLAASRQLLAGAVAVWPPMVAWRVTGVRSGVRALPPRGPQGSVPLVGRWGAPPPAAAAAPPAAPAAPRTTSSSWGPAAAAAAAQAAPAAPHSRDQQERGAGGVSGPPVWLCVGLGARGLVYHAWLGALVAEGLLQDSQQHLPPELRAWQAAVTPNDGGP